MAATFREQRLAPIGNSFVEHSGPSQFDALLSGEAQGRYKLPALALMKFGPSRLRRRHSIGGYVPFGLRRSLETSRPPSPAPRKGRMMDTDDEDAIGAKAMPTVFAGTPEKGWRMCWADTDDELAEHEPLRMKKAIPRLSWASESSDIEGDVTNLTSQEQQEPTTKCTGGSSWASGSSEVASAQPQPTTCSRLGSWASEFSDTVLEAADGSPQLPCIEVQQPARNGSKVSSWSSECSDSETGNEHITDVEPFAEEQSAGSADIVLSQLDAWTSDEAWNLDSPRDNFGRVPWAPMQLAWLEEEDAVGDCEKPVRRPPGTFVLPAGATTMAATVTKAATATKASEGGASDSGGAAGKPVVQLSLASFLSAPSPQALATQPAPACQQPGLLALRPQPTVAVVGPQVAYPKHAAMCVMPPLQLMPPHQQLQRPQQPRKQGQQPQQHRQTTQPRKQPSNRHFVGVDDIDARERHCDPAGMTTVMIRNLPSALSQPCFLSELDSSGFKDLYNFAYMPSSFEESHGKGFAFVNFLTPAIAGTFMGAWYRSQRFGNEGTQLNLSPAALQGLEANYGRWARQRIDRIRNPAFRPFFMFPNADGGSGATSAGPRRTAPAGVAPVGGLTSSTGVALQRVGI